MSDQVLVPPEQSVTTRVNITPISKTVTNTAAGLLTTDVPCNGVWLQSSALDDSNGAITSTVKIYVSKTLSGTAIKFCEMVVGESKWIPCNNTSELQIVTQSGSGWVRGYALMYDNQ